MRQRGHQQRDVEAIGDDGGDADEKYHAQRAQFSTRWIMRGMNSCTGCIWTTAGLLLLMNLLLANVVGAVAFYYIGRTLQLDYIIYGMK